jgi:hypothetical protein
MANRELFEKVCFFIKNSGFWCGDILTSETSLENDLGITGDDAVDLLKRFSEQFEIDMRKLNVSKYFESEGGNMFDIMARTFFREKGKNLIELKLKHLELALTKGKLCDNMMEDF